MTEYHNPKRYMAIFVLCFVGIAALQVAAYVINGQIVARQQEIARFAQLGDRQRTLSLRVALLVDEYTETGDPQIQAAKRQAIDEAASEMRRLHRLMTMGDPDAGYPVPDTETVDQIIFGQPIFLDQTMRLFLFGVDEMIGRPWVDDLARLPYMADIKAAAGGALSTGLDRLNEAMREAGESRVAQLKLVLAATSVVIVLIVLGLAFFVIMPMLRRVTEQTSELIEMAQTDPLTGCHNRRSFMREADSEFDRFKRYGGVFAVIMLDIDHFKSVNDTYGHAAGDEVIRALARISLEQTRSSDVLGRLGGEEFAVLLPEATIESATLTGEKLRAAFAAASVEHNGKTIRFTASLGVTVAGKDDEEFFNVLNRADEALYVAKHGGRNRLEAKAPKPL